MTTPDNALIEAKHLQLAKAIRGIGANSFINKWLDQAADAIESLHAENAEQADRITSLEAELVTQTNRAAAAEQQVTALTQRLDTANALNTEARDELAKLALKYDDLDGEFRSQNNLSGILSERVQELQAERDEADRRAGAAEREMQTLKDTIARLNSVRSKQKREWGVDENTSFDAVWNEALALKAQPTNVWQQAIDHELVCAHLGVAGDVSFAEAVKALNKLISWHVLVATDPQCNGGLSLQPVDKAQAV